MKPRVLFVGRTRYSLPLPAWLQRKWDALGDELDYRVLARAEGEAVRDERFRLGRALRPRALDGLASYLALPFRVRRQLLEFSPDAVIAENPHVAAAVLLGRALVRSRRPALILEVHGDWRTATRLYGSPRRRLLSPLGDAVARHAVRRADAVRALSPFTARLAEELRGVPVDAAFPTFSDLGAFAARPREPLPAIPTALFVGVLEPYKNVAGLAAAWRRVAAQVSEARLGVVGRGSLDRLVDDLGSEFPGRVEHVRESLSPDSVAARMDASWALVLPSRYEGLGRVVIESFARGRGVVASGQGGILDLVRDGVEGLLVDPDEVESIATALARVLGERSLAERLGASAHEAFAAWSSTPEEFAARTRALVDSAVRP